MSREFQQAFYRISSAGVKPNYTPYQIAHVLQVAKERIAMDCLSLKLPNEVRQAIESLHISSTAILVKIMKGAEAFHVQ